ncbi:MAG: hypothetical protein HY961_03705 [Ignavibacteriae bacterium]|nr:hypothetical protein [Ignavibacteriota bacterium]
MKKLLLLTALVACLGAALRGQEKDDPDSRATYHLSFADSLETAGAFQGAALVYKMVAELYPGTMAYADAVRNLAHLYVNPFNSARNDSIALSWFVKHLEIPWLPRGERTRSVIMASLVRERMQFSTVEGRRSSVVDSLRTLARIQSAELNAQSKKIVELSSELEQTDNDLQILLEFQKNPTVARKDTTIPSSTAQKLADANESTTQAKRKTDRTEQSNDQLQKLREIDLRALQRRAKR